MATKEATIFIVDVGSTTAECHNGRIESDLDYGMQYVWDKIAATLATNRTTLNVGVLALRHDETDNPLGSTEGYDHIATLKDLGPINMTHLTDLQVKIRPSSTTIGDAISAIVVAVDIIEKFTTLKGGKPGKYKRKIVLLTDGQGSMDGSDLEPIAARINEFGIELVVVGTDFDEVEFGFKEEDKPEHKRDNERLLKSLVGSCGGIFATTVEAIENLAIPDVKETKPYASYKGKLSLGDFNRNPDTALYIDVERYFKTKTARPPGASSFTTRSTVGGEPSGQSSHTVDGDTEMKDASDLAQVRSKFEYQVNDPSAPGGKRHVEREELSRGYLYGSTAVPISTEDENVTKLETVQSFEIIGFIPSDKYERYLNMGECNVTVGQSVNDKARLAFSSLVHALYELDSYAVARLVDKEGKDPRIVVMAPVVDPGLEALYDVPIPFAEDVRIYRFPPLDRVITTSGATMTKHRNLPSDDLVNAMSDYVDTMDLSTFGKDDDGQPTEYMPIDETYSPAIHRIQQAIRTRAVQPDKSVAPPAEILIKWSKPPEELVTKAAPQLKKLIKAADVKMVEKKAKGKRYGREQITPLSGLDLDSLLASEKPRKITMENSIPDFKHLLNHTTSESMVLDAADQMVKIIHKMVTEIRDPFPPERIVENVRVLRTELLEHEVPVIYNDFIRDFRQKLTKGEFGNDKKTLLFLLKKARVGLIDNEVLDKSDVSKEEADEFWLENRDLPTRSK